MIDKEKEEELFRQMQEGDVCAFEYFFKEYVSLLYTYALGFTKAKEVAEDIVQDVYAYFWNKRRQVLYTGSMYAYLQRAVKNACINRRLHEDVERKYKQEILFTEEEAFDWRDEESVRELRQRLFDAIDRLPERCRDIFRQSCQDGLKYREIAEQMGISENTVKTQIKLAYKKLREEMNISGVDLAVLIVLFPFFGD